MKDRPLPGDEAEIEELDLGSGDEEMIEEAMKEALEAVEEIRLEREADDRHGSVEAEVEGDTEAGLREEVKELRDRSMRTLADFDNFRKRAEKERNEQRRYAGVEIMRDLLVVVDSLERAVGARGSLEELREGVELILRQIAELLKRHGVERVSTGDGRFDPASHEAVTRHESDDVAEPTIVKELQAGYRLRDRLLRPALVEVAVPNEPAAEPIDGSGEPGI
ncbi:MAG: nucleotide exchange factor GrpE [Acidobacteria bacterium]|nr:nucleotide exchange factor GrpE [Acidobacteriota bacterium]